MLEKEVERKLCKRVKDRGGIAFKFVSPGHAGVPDRLVLLPGTHIGFVEVKAPDKQPTKLQAAYHQKIKKLGFRVYVLDNPDRIGGILDDIQTT